MAKVEDQTPNKVIYKKCTGDAHENPMIDHCGICMPYWEVYPTCPLCHRKAKRSNRVPFSYYCTSCHKYLMDNADQKMDIYGDVYKAKPDVAPEFEATDHWNYRIVKMIYKSEVEYSIHEVYYTKDGRPVMLTDDEISPAGSSATEFARSVLAYNECYCKPVLVYDKEQNKFTEEEPAIL